MSRVARALGRLAQQAGAGAGSSSAAIAGCEATAAGALSQQQSVQQLAKPSSPFGLACRRYTDVSTHYSPKQFSKEKPFDKSAAWIPKNPYIEAWVVRRDKMEREFSWSARNSFEMGYVVIGFSIAFYAFSVWTIRTSDARNHYPKRDMLFAQTGTQFLLPDERDWY